MYEDYQDTIEAPQQVVPIDFHDLWKRYTINIRTGCVYDNNYGIYVLPYHGEDQELYVDLESEELGTITCQLSSLLVRMLYGRTDSGAYGSCTTFPVNDKVLSPDIYTFEKHCKDNQTWLVINGIMYRQWRDTPYFANTYGAIFSLKMFQWLRVSYNEKFYAVTTLKTLPEGASKYKKVHRLVWETFNGLIPPDLEIDHIDGRRYHNDLSNLQLLTHIENLNKRDPGKYAYVNKEDLRQMCELFEQGVPVKEIARRYNLTEIYVWKIRTGRIFDKITREFGYKPEVYGARSKKFDPVQIREIRSRHSAGEKLWSIAKAFNTTKSTISDIAKRRIYKNVD